MYEFWVVNKGSNKHKKALLSLAITFAISLVFLTIITVLQFETYLIPLIVLAVLALDLITLRIFRKKKKFFRTIKNVKSIIESANQQLVTLKKPIKYSLGYIIIEGKWISKGQSRHYNIYREFKEIKSNHSDKIHLEYGFLSDFTIISDGYGNGYIRLPSILVKDEEAENGLIIFIPSNILFKTYSNNLKLKITSGDELYISAKINRDTLNGKLIYTGKHKSKAAKIILIGTIENTKLHNKLTIEKKVYEVPTAGMHNFIIRIYVPEPLIIITHLEDVSAIDIINALRRYDTNYSEAFLYGFSDGSYKLKIELSLPFEPNKYVEEPIVFAKIH